MTHAGTNLQISRGIGSNLFGKKEKATNRRQSGPSVGTSGTRVRGGRGRRSDCVNICVIVTWSSGKPSKAPLRTLFLRRAYQCLSLCSPPPFLDRGGKEGASGREWGEQFPACSVGFFPATTEKGRESGRKRRKENKGTAKADFIRSPLLSIQTN